MKKTKILHSVCMVFITLPIWLYLLHYILTSIEAGSLQMFLYWAYVPFSLIVAFTNKLMEDVG